jgi:class 3 adenylate cyclase
MLDGQRRDLAVIFGDLRDFTAFSAGAEPEVIMAVLSEYYEALGEVVTRRMVRLSICFRARDYSTQP